MEKRIIKHCNNEEHLNDACILQVTNDSSETFFCLECLTEKEYNTNDLVVLEECIINNHDKILKNWPPGVTPELTQLLKDKMMKASQNSPQLEKVNKFFDDLISFTFDEIQEMRKKILAQFIAASSAESRMETYNNISQRDKLSSTLKEDSNQNLTAFINEMIANKSKNAEMLKSFVTESSVDIDIYKNEEFQLVNKQIKSSLNQLHQKISGLLNNQIPFSFKKTDSSQLQISQENRHSPVVINNTQSVGIAYSDFVLDNQLKYVVRFSLNQPLYMLNDIDIGLSVSDQAMEKWDFNYRMSSCSSGGLNSFQPFQLYDKASEFKDTINQIELRVCLKDNVVEFRDYPEYRTVNFLNPTIQLKNKVDISKQFRIYVWMNKDGPNKQITVDEIKVVNSFAPDFPLDR